MTNEEHLYFINGIQVPPFDTPTENTEQDKPKHRCVAMNGCPIDHARAEQATQNNEIVMNADEASKHSDASFDALVNKNLGKVNNALVQATNKGNKLVRIMVPVSTLDILCDYLMSENFEVQYKLENNCEQATLTIEWD